MQCYALSRVVAEMGHEVQVIHIELPRSKMSWKGKIDVSVLNFRYGRFRKQFYPIETIAYHSAEELRTNIPKADAYIVGSDQVWNPAITSAFGSEVFFLDFVPEDCKRIAYAASFGSSVWVSLGKEKDEEVKRLLHRFNAISVRELDGVDICRSQFGIDNAVAVIDPVFLLNDYSNIIGRSISVKNEVMCYPLCTNEATKSIFMQVAADLNLAPISYSRAIRGNGIKVKMFTTIQGWLRGIKSSQIVVTNSFHCMAFCILFHKKFIVTPPAVGRESRMLSMLSLLGLSNRYVSTISDYYKRKDYLLSEIDYNNVQTLLEQLRSDSISYLKSIL